MTETLAHGYLSGSTQRELFNGCQHKQGLDGFQKSLRPCALDNRSLSIGRVKPLSYLVIYLTLVRRASTGIRLKLFLIGDMVLLK